MAPGHPTRASTPSYIPSTKLLAWTVVTGTLLVTGALRDGQPPQPSAGQAFSAPAAPAADPTAPAAPTTGPTAPAADPAVRPLRPSPPVRLRIPAIGVDAPMGELHLDASGALRPPPADAPGLVGWYGGGTPPGSAGTAVTTGHVDLPTGAPGVFYGLGSVVKGHTVEVDRADRRTAVFTVDAVEVYDKERFPDDKVYGSSDRAELRVITCGGGYTERTGYQGNVVVYATLTAVR
ncbi:class F sortase [Streptomyces sp. NPDC014882]|uniref:class F sortase n=1 Tax=Streptomyces sp. NPDC014882 TaxID=3364927 RepID=UPI0036F7C4DB